MKLELGELLSMTDPPPFCETGVGGRPGMPTSWSGRGAQVWFLAPAPDLCWCAVGTHWEATDEGWSWVPAAYVGDPDCVLGSWLMGTRGVSQQLVPLPPSACSHLSFLFASQINR